MNEKFSISESWDNVLGETGLELVQNIFEQALNLFLTPKKEDIFNAFKYTDFEAVKVLILGQDPYPNPAHAHGLAFSSRAEKCPASLKNIFKVINKNFATNFEFKTWELTSWAEQGVMLLNTALTFYDEKSQNKNLKLWKPFIDLVLEKLSKKNSPLVVMLWGNKAQERALPFFEGKENVLVLTSTHPSPLGAGKGDNCFIECNHFKACNDFLKQHKLSEIDWFMVN
ncbi:uracil-DNA glycosylase [bacterium]|nr:uracil-DNA glycosylase [bacterium]